MEKRCCSIYQAFGTEGLIDKVRGPKAPHPSASGRSPGDAVFGVKLMKARSGWM